MTGDSLQYAFVEFENRKACEDAYFKMDNVLIDDRRIHVDFSQSVARIRWKGKGMQLLSWLIIDILQAWNLICVREGSCLYVYVRMCQEFYW